MSVLRATALVVVPVVASLVVAAPAASKELRKARLCGSSDCVQMSDLSRLADLGPDGLWSDQPAAPSPYYRIELYFAGHRTDLYWVPATHKVAGSGDRGMTWQEANKAVSRLLRDASRGLQPLPVPQVDAAQLGPNDLSGDPNRYLGVFRDTQGAGTFEGGRIELDLYSNQRSPWTDGSVDFYPEANSLRFGLSVVRVSDQGAALLEGEDNGFPSRVLLVLFASAAAAIAAAAVLRARAQRAHAKASVASAVDQRSQVHG